MLEEEINGKANRQEHNGASLAAQLVKNLPAMQETWLPSLGWEDSLEKGMAIHSSILAWIIPWTEELGTMWHVWRLWLAVSEQRKYGREMRDLNSFLVTVTYSWLSVPELKSQWREFWLSLSEVCTFQPVNSSWKVRLISELGSSNGNHMDGVRGEHSSHKGKKRKVLFPKWKNNGCYLKWVIHESTQVLWFREIWQFWLPLSWGRLNKSSYVQLWKRNNAAKTEKSYLRLHRW